MIGIFINGFLVGCGLIIAIGAQNAFVLSKGIRREHRIIIPLICSLCDAALIFTGVAGLGSLLSSDSSFTTWAALFGAAFLFWYGLLSFRKVFDNNTMDPEYIKSDSLKSAVLTTLAVTLLNPHVYLDTVILLGTISSQFGRHKYIFGFGAATASFVWFFALSIAGSALADLFKKPLCWKVLDSAVGATMWLIATRLIFEAVCKV